MLEDYLKGGRKNSLKKIAERYGRGIQTVSAIVKSVSTEKMIEECKESLIKLTAEAVVERLLNEVKSQKSKDGAWVAMDLAEKLGIVPGKIIRTQGIMEEAVSGKLIANGEETRVKRWVEKLTEVTMERGRIFGMPMPEIRDVLDEKILDLEEDGKKEKEIHVRK